MNLKLFYSPPKWLAFEAPDPQWGDKCNFDCRHFSKSSLEQFCGCYNSYHQAYAEAKANALEVGNPSICPQNMSQVELGKDYDWPYKSKIIDGKIILSL